MSYRTRWGPDGPPEEAYSRVTDAERFRPLHAAMRKIIVRLHSEYDVTLDEGYGLDEELERHMTPASPSVKLTPSDSGAAPIPIVFSDFPGLHVRFGRWLTQPFPICGCDACDESAEGEIERLTDAVRDVTAGRFREAVRIPLLASFTWPMGEMWSDRASWSGGGPRIDRQQALGLTGGARQLELNWKPWPQRPPPG